MGDRHYGVTADGTRWLIQPDGSIVCVICEAVWTRTHRSSTCDAGGGRRQQRRLRHPPHALRRGSGPGLPGRRDTLGGAAVTDPRRPYPGPVARAEDDAPVWVAVLLMTVLMLPVHAVLFVAFFGCPAFLKLG